MVLSRCVLLFSLLSGCFSPSIADGTIECDLGSASECPPGFTCRADNRCYRGGADELDGGASDGGQVDGGIVGDPGEVAWATPGQGQSFDKGLAIAAGSSVVFAGLFASPNFTMGGEAAEANSSDDGVMAEMNPATGVVDRLRVIGGPFPDSIRAAALDASGNRLVAGHFGSTVTFGAGQSRTAMGASDVFVAKYAPGGDLLWVTVLPGTGNIDSIDAIDVDAATGRVFAVGRFDGSIDFLDGNGAIAAVGATDAFVVALDMAGDTIWAEPLPSDGSAEAVAVTFAGDRVVVAGHYEAKLLPGTVLEQLATAGSDVFAVSLTAAGAFTWSKSFGGSGDDVGRGVAANASSVWLSGKITSGGSFAPVVHDAFDNVLGDGFVVELDLATGVPKTLRALRSGTGGVVAAALAIASDGAIAVVGTFDGAVDFGDGIPLEEVVDSFIALYPGGIEDPPVWVRSFGGLGNDEAAAVAFDGTTRIVAAGSFSTAIDFDGEIFTVQGSNPDLFALSLWR